LKVVIVAMLMMATNAQHPTDDGSSLTFSNSEQQFDSQNVRSHLSNKVGIVEKSSSKLSTWKLWFG